MFNKKGRKESYTLGTLITVFVVIMLVVMGPAQAVSVLISGLQPSYTESSSIQFQVSIEIKAPDQFVPVTDIDLNVMGPANMDRKFAVDGTPISGNPDISITPVSYPLSTDYGYGYGIDDADGTRYNFGNGSGYGNGREDLNFIYDVTITTTSLPTGTYNVIANLNTGKEIKPAFSSAPVVFTIVPTINTDINIDPDTLNLNSEGRYIIAHIELPDGYSPADIDVSSIKLNGDIVPAEDKPVEIGTDLMVRFDRASVQAILSPGDNLLTVTGMLTNGMGFEGSDTIKVVDNKD